MRFYDGVEDAHRARRLLGRSAPRVVPAAVVSEVLGVALAPCWSSAEETSEHRQRGNYEDADGDLCGVGGY